MAPNDWTPERAQDAARAQGMCGEIVNGGRDVCILTPGHGPHGGVVFIVIQPNEHGQPRIQGVFADRDKAHAMIQPGEHGTVEEWGIT